MRTPKVESGMYVTVRDDARIFIVSDHQEANINTVTLEPVDEGGDEIRVVQFYTFEVRNVRPFWVQADMDFFRIDGKWKFHVEAIVLKVYPSGQKRYHAVGLRDRRAGRCDLSVMAKKFI